MKNQAMVSVVMSVYNGEKYLKRAIDSILGQTLNDFEFIIVDDGSTDGTKAILESYSDGRIKLIINENKGQTKSLNEAIGHSRGEYIARMDADDVSIPTRLERQVYLMESDQDIAMCGSFADVIDSEGKYIRKYTVPMSSKEIRRMILIHNPFIHPSVMIRREVLDEVGYYDESYKYAQDYELWTRMVFRYKTANIPRVLLKYRVHDRQMTGTKKLKMTIEGIRVRISGTIGSIVR